MSRLDDLINKLCPDGVECFTVSTVFDEIKGMSGVSNKWADEGNCRFIDYLNAYNNLSIDVTKLPFATVKNLNQDKLKKGDILFTSASEVPDECAIASAIEKDIEDGIFLDDHLFGMRPKAEFAAKIATGYLKHYFHTIEYRKSVLKAVRGVTRFYISKQDFMKIVFPLPPIEVQNEIVRILDSFTELEEELEEELEARRRQYEYYRDSLLTFDDSVEWKILGEISTVNRGIRVTRDMLSTEGVIPVYQNALTPLGYFEKSNRKQDTTFVISAGAAGQIGYSGIDFWAADDCFTFDDTKNVLSKYIFYFLQTKQSFIDSRVRRGSIPRISRDVFEKMKIPIPKLEEQKRIVEILDHFESLCNDLSSGLPAEIEARQKQYEYYRDKLLMFKEK